MSKSAEAACYDDLGLAYRDLNDYSKAIEFNEKALDIAKEIRDVYMEASIYSNLGEIHYENTPEISYKCYKHSIELTELIGGRLIEEEHMIDLYALESSSRIYRRIILLCLKLSKEREAFEYAERSRLVRSDIRFREFYIQAELSLE